MASAIDRNFRTPGSGRSFNRNQTDIIAAIRDTVEREWRKVRRDAASEALYEALRSRYTIRVERPEELGTPDDPAVAEILP